MTKRIAFAIFTLALSYFSTTWAAEDLIGLKIREINSRVNPRAAGSEDCKTIPQTIEKCDFKNYCNSLAGKASEPTLFRNNRGEGVSNPSFIKTQKLIYKCSGETKHPDLLNDPFVNPELLLKKDRFDKFKKEYEKKAPRAQAVFKQAKEDILAILEEQKKKNPSQAKKIDDMKTRISSVTMETPGVGNHQDFWDGGCDTPNAFFKLSEQKIFICPQYYDMPTEAIYQTMAHELGHAIDSCTMSFPLRSEGGKPKLDITSVSKNFVASGEIASPAYSPESHPHSSTLQCLSSRESMGIKSKGTHQAKSEMEETLKSMRAEGATPAAIAEFEKEMRASLKVHDQHQHCAEFGGNGHIGEAYADWLAAQALSYRVSQSPGMETKKEWAFYGLLPRAAVSCPELKSDAIFQFVDGLDDEARRRCAGLIRNADPEMEALMAEYSKTHPSPSKRLNKIFMAEPEIQKALGCKPDPSFKKCP